jgi:hypothetical protein
MNSGTATDMQTWAKERGASIHAALYKDKYVITIVGDRKTVMKAGDGLEATLIDAVRAWDMDR